VSISVQSLATMLTSLLTGIIFNSGNHSLLNIMKIRALCPISGQNNSRKRYEMRLISKLETAHPNGINECFPFV
jgi:hypothetical protein